MATSTDVKTPLNLSTFAKDRPVRFPDTKKLFGILDDFQPEVFDEAWTMVTDGAPTHLKTRDLPDPGPPVAIGEEGRVELEELAAMERIIMPDNNLLPVHFLEEGASVQRAVGRLALLEPWAGLPTGSGWGTGFMVSPTVLMTNNHVIPSIAFARRLHVQFNYQLDYAGNPQQLDAFSFDPDDLFYTNVALDFTLIRVRAKSLFAPFRHMGAETGFVTEPFVSQERLVTMPSTTMGTMPIATDWMDRMARMRYTAGQRWGFLRLPTTMAAFATQQHINIIQHPQGRRKEVALQQNRLDTIYSNVVRYTTDTEPGSSGSPVFNNAWDLMAIHHAGGDFVDGAWVNNEGVRMDRIVADIRAHYHGSTGATVLTDLGL